MTVSTAAGLVLTGIGPRGLFGFFLDKQKEATVFQKCGENFSTFETKNVEKILNQYTAS